MTNLKTLKDFETEEITHAEASLITDLRAEAVKTVKSVKHLDSWTIPDDNERMIDNAVDWIKHFFNLTEEDLK